ncbi:MAG: hypothetical protein CMH79_05850 [Nitrospinae bacterium]|nr:hypothetical protein [Nitrospinota bacterium]|tara:strand:- start:275 stop:622 length:348 start_codon:yes stop_codon:yes gene_type:complete
MIIEPLKNLLDGENKDEIKQIIYDILPAKDKKKIKNWRYEYGKVYINDRLVCIRRDTLSVEYIGRIIYINEKKLGIRLSKYRTVCIDPNEYYIFLKNKTKDMIKRETMGQLLEKL